MQQIPYERLLSKKTEWNHAICGTWIHKEMTTPGRESQTEKNKYHWYHLMVESKPWYKWTSVLTKEEND